MTKRCLRMLLLCGLLGMGGAISACAQSENVKTVEGPRGEKTVLTARPHQVADGLSVRAMGISTPDTVRWALSLIGTTRTSPIALVYGDEELPIERVHRPEDGVGPTRVFVSQNAFLTMAETGAVRMKVETATVALPEPLRREMKQIFEQVL